MTSEEIVGLIILTTMCIGALLYLAALLFTKNE